MFILSITLMLLQEAPAPAPTEIVVIGQRLARWTGTYQIKGSRMKCATKISTGDREIDAIGCAAFETCADILAPRIAATDDKSLDTATRLSMKAAVKHDLSACVADKRVELIGNLARARTKTPAQ